MIFNPFIKKTFSPQKVQQNILRDILKKNAHTTFGKRYNFNAIKDYTAFATTVPIQDYESLRPYLEEQEKNKIHALVNATIIMYAYTSGTTGKAKQVPILKKTLKKYKKQQAICSYAQYMGVPGLYKGKILAITSPAIEGKNSLGSLIGSMSGIIYEKMPHFVRKKYVIPNEVMAITDYRIKYLLIAAFSLVDKNITIMGTANPSSFLKLMQVINQDKEQLLGFIAHGNVEIFNIQDTDLKNKCIKIVQKYFKPSLNRSMELNKLINDSGTFVQFWPSLKAVVTWTKGNCSVLIPKLQSLLPKVYTVEMGYLSTEFRGSIVVDTKDNRAVPSIDEVFLEFVEQSDWENDNFNFYTLDQLTVNNNYYIFVTTSNGLYRYFINDIIKVTGKFNNTPTLVFVQKGKGVTNLTGEKLYEIQIIDSVSSACNITNIKSHFYIMIGNPETVQYTLYIQHPPISDDFGKILDEALSESNIEYKAKLSSGRLLPTKVCYLKPGADEIYKQHCLEKGQREGQYKITQLQLAKDCLFDFSTVCYA